MKEIKIQNSNLLLKEIDIGGVKEYCLGSDKTKMRYQFLTGYYYNENTIGTSFVIFTYGLKTVNFNENKNKKLLILLQTNKKFEEDIKLSKEEATSVLLFLKEFIQLYPLECEPLIMALRNKELFNLYSQNFGGSLKLELLPRILKYIQCPDNLYINDKNSEFVWKGNRKYSVLDFLEELKNDPNSKIEAVPDIIDYNRISPKVVDNSKNTIEYIKEPGEIVSISKTKRANVNLTYKTYVNVTTQNGVVYNKLSTLKNICIINRGRLNTKYICVVINSNFAKKLKRRGAIYVKLLKDTYIIDLSKLPLFNRRNIGSVQSWELKYHEYKYQCSKFQKEYIKFLMKKNNIDLPETPEIDLKTNTYNPKKVSKKSNTSYDIYSYETYISDRYFPKNSIERMITFNNYLSLDPESITFKLINEINKFLDSGKQLIDLYNYAHKDTNDYSTILSNAKFKLILSKNCRFNSGHGEKAYGKNETLRGKYGEINLKWDIEKQKIYTYVL